MVACAATPARHMIDTSPGTASDSSTVPTAAPLSVGRLGGVSAERRIGVSCAPVGRPWYLLLLGDLLGAREHRTVSQNTAARRASAGSTKRRDRGADLCGYLAVVQVAHHDQAVLARPS